MFVPRSEGSFLARKQRKRRTIVLYIKNYCFVYKDREELKLG